MKEGERDERKKAKQSKVKAKTRFGRNWCGCFVTAYSVLTSDVRMWHHHVYVGRSRAAHGSRLIRALGLGSGGIEEGWRIHDTPFYFSEAEFPREGGYGKEGRVKYDP